jgi:DNA-binding response OmpR family regulator
MSTVLIIDDDPSLLDALTMALEDAGHTVLAATDGTGGLTLIRSKHPDLVVSDVNMPGLDGFSLCRRLRQENDQVPFIVLTSRDNEIDETLGLELGADDYVTKPFSMRVLVARVAALLRREALRRDPEGEEPVVRGAVQLLPGRLEVLCAGVSIQLTVTEFRLLEALMRRPGRVLTRDRLLDLARGDSSVVADRIIDTYVRRIRRKLEAADPTFEAIETVIGMGYRWRESSPTHGG